MKTNIKSIAAIAVMAIFWGTLASGQTSAPPSKTASRTKTRSASGSSSKSARTGRISKTDIKYTMYKYIRLYKPTEEQKAKLEKVLQAQQKDLADYEKVYAPKIKVVDDKIAALQKEIASLRASKSVYADKRAELLLDHKAEVNKVFTEQQRITSLASYLKNITVYRHWAGFSKAQQADLTEQFEAAATKIVQAKPEDADKVLAAQRSEMQKVVAKIMTPEIRQAGEAGYMAQSAVRALYRIKLTDDQKAHIRKLCDAAAKRRSDLYAKYAQATKDRDTLRKAMYSLGSTSSHRKLHAEISEKVLTEEQRKALSSRSSRYRSSRRSSRTSTRKSGAKPAKTDKPSGDRTKTTQ